MREEMKMREKGENGRGPSDDRGNRMIKEEGNNGIGLKYKRRRKQSGKRETSKGEGKWHERGETAWERENSIGTMERERYESRRTAKESGND
jgi:hypothetical protein